MAAPAPSSDDRTMVTHPPSCPHHFLDLSEPGPDACAVVPFPPGALSLELAQRVAGTCNLAQAEIVISDGCRSVLAAYVPALLALRGSILELECRGPDARRAMGLVSQQLRGLHGVLAAGVARP
jgi:hypothetical protein